MCFTNACSLVPYKCGEDFTKTGGTSDGDTAQKLSQRGAARGRGGYFCPMTKYVVYMYSGTSTYSLKQDRARESHFRARI